MIEKTARLDHTVLWRRCDGGIVEVRRYGRCFGACGLHDARQIVSTSVSPWYAPRVYCACGDSWSEGELRERPFRRGWRQEAQHRFERRWDSAHPEGTVLERDDDLYIVRAVTAPDSRAVASERAERSGP